MIPRTPRTLLLAASLVLSVTTAACSGKVVQILDPDDAGSVDAGNEPTTCSGAGGACVANEAACTPSKGTLGAASLSCAGGGVCCFATACAAEPDMECCQAGVTDRPRCDGTKLTCAPGFARVPAGTCACEALGASCGTSFASQVMPLLVEKCGSPSCHGAPAGAKPQIDRASLSATRANLLAMKPIGNRPYVSVCNPDPDASSILCNIAKTNTCGNAMPLGAAGSLAGSPLETSLRAWLACGAPDN